MIIVLHSIKNSMKLHNKKLDNYNKFYSFLITYCCGVTDIRTYHLAPRTLDRSPRTLDLRVTTTAFCRLHSYPDCNTVSFV